MLMSMTGFGAAEDQFKFKRGKVEARVEIKTVNSKFLDINLRSPKPYIVFDSEISSLLKGSFRRGRVDLTLSLQTIEGAERRIHVNTSQALALKKSYEQCMKALKISGSVDLKDLLLHPEWLEMRDVDINEKEEWTKIKTLIETAIEQVIESRKSEGKSLARILQEQKAKFIEHYSSILKLQDDLMTQLRTRTVERIEGLIASTAIDRPRLEQEVAIWVAKSDFKEELDRISHHLETMDELLSSGTEVGRKMEFVLQELHREVNTLGSKCPDARVTRTIIEMKTALERLKEQIQNVE